MDFIGRKVCGTIYIDGVKKSLKPKLKNVNFVVSKVFGIEQCGEGRQNSASCHCIPGCTCMYVCVIYHAKKVLFLAYHLE